MKSMKASTGKSETIGRTYCNEIQPIKTFVESKSATDFKGFEALLFLTSTTNCFARMFKRELDICMMNCDDRLRHFNETSTN